MRYWTEGYQWQVVERQLGMIGVLLDGVEWWQSLFG